MRLEIRELRLPLRAPLRTARGLLTHREGFELRIRDGQGRVGLGEATPLVELGGASVESTGEALRSLSAQLAALPAEELVEPAAIDALLDRHPALERTPAARFGLETALLDRAARERQLPLARLLEPTARGSVEVNALLTTGEPEEVTEQTRAACEAGFRTLKVKVAAGPLADDLRKLERVRAAASPSLRVRVDANGGWSMGQAQEALGALAPLSLELCEQPVAKADELRALAGQSAVPLAADECLREPQAISTLLAGGPTVSVLVLKPALVGGLVRALELARRARARGLLCYVTSGIDGEIARAATAHLAAALPGSSLAHGLGVGPLLAAPDRHRWLVPRLGALALPEQPGVGLEDWT